MFLYPTIQLLFVTSFSKHGAVCHVRFKLYFDSCDIILIYIFFFSISDQDISELYAELFGEISDDDDDDDNDGDDDCDNSDNDDDEMEDDSSDSDSDSSDSENGIYNLFVWSHLLKQAGGIKGPVFRPFIL